MSRRNPVDEHATPQRSELGVPSTKAESPYPQLFDVSPFPAVVSRVHDNTVLAINARTSEVIGIPQREATGLSVSDFYVDPSERVQLVERLRRDGRADNLRLRVKRANGEPFWVLASSRLVTWQEEPAVLTVFHDISEQLAAETSLKAGERRLVAQSDALTGLTARYTNPSEPFGERLRSILEMAAHALEVERLSMWRFDEERSSIHCMGMYRRPGRQYESGSVLQSHHAPRYFEALEHDRVVAANDARTDPRTCEFRDSYLIPNDIGAMLDVPLRHDNTTVGVICAELSVADRWDQQKARAWWELHDPKLTGRA